MLAILGLAAHLQRRHLGAVEVSVFGVKVLPGHRGLVRAGPVDRTVSSPAAALAFTEAVTLGPLVMAAALAPKVAGFRMSTTCQSRQVKF